MARGLVLAGLAAVRPLVVGPLDHAGSSAGAAKYRGGPARIVVVTHHGRGWFDPRADEPDDVIALARYLEGGSLGHSRKALRPLAGIAPVRDAGVRTDLPPASFGASAAWARACSAVPGSPAWNYFVDGRGLPATTVERAVEAGGLREGIRGTCWTFHRT